MKIIPEEQMKSFQHQPSRYSRLEYDAIKKQIDGWISDGVVRKSTLSFAIRVVLVKKRNGTYRACVDFRQLNSMLLRDCLPVPLLDDVLKRLQEPAVFIVIGLENSFLHVPIEESSRFITRAGLLEFCRPPYGFCNSSAMFNSFVNSVIQELITNDVMQMYVDHHIRKNQR